MKLQQEERKKKGKKSNYTEKIKNEGRKNKKNALDGRRLQENTTTNDLH